MNHVIPQQGRSKMLPLLRKFHQNQGKSITRQFQACKDIILMWQASSREKRIHFNLIMIHDAHFIARLMKFFELDFNSFSQWKQAQFQACMLLEMILHKREHMGNVFVQAFKQAVNKFAESDDLIRKLIEFITRLLTISDDHDAYDKDSCNIVKKNLNCCMYLLCILCIESSKCCSQTIVNDGMQILEKFAISHVALMQDSSQLSRLKRLLEDKSDDKHSDDDKFTYVERFIENELENNIEGIIPMFAHKIAQLACTTHYLCRAASLCIAENMIATSEIHEFSRYCIYYI